MANNSKLMGSRTYSGTFPSPETPPCGEDDVGIPKGWSSERVPSSSYRTRRYVAAAALMPFSSGRTLPSKWEDAERWICSPVSLGNVSSNSNYCYYGVGPESGSRTGVHLTQYQRRAKSKSGPLGPDGPDFFGGGYNSFSPVLGVGVINGGRWRNSLTIEPSGLASAQFEERLQIEGGGGGGGEEARGSCPGHDNHWLESWSGPPSPTQDEVSSNNGEHNEVLENNLEQENDNGEVRVDRAISRRDMATQMFPDSPSNSTSSVVSSTKSSISNTSPRPLLFNESRRDVQTSEYEVRDVQVDKQTSTSRSHHDMKDNYSNDRTSIEVHNRFSKYERKEARINSWENLQKAKAEAAIQKLEEKLEKKRASSMHKIMRKLRKAEIKAEKMRNIISNDGDHIESQAISKTSKIPSLCRMIRLNSSTKKCATCYPF